MNIPKLTKEEYRSLRSLVDRRANGSIDQSIIKDLKGWIIQIYQCGNAY